MKTSLHNQSKLLSAKEEQSPSLKGQEICATGFDTSIDQLRTEGVRQTETNVTVTFGQGSNTSPGKGHTKGLYAACAPPCTH